METHTSHKFFPRRFLTQPLATISLLLAGAGLLLPVRIARASCAPAPPGLLSWWRAEGSAVDTVGTNHGTLQGGTSYAAGEVGQAFSFNGLGSTIQVADAPGLDFNSNSPLTIELWAYRSGGQTTMHLLGKRATACGTVQYEISFDPFGGLAFYAGNGSVQTGLPMPTNTWIHLAGTFDGTNTFSFYTNGVLAATGTGNLGPSNNAPFTIGTSGGCSFFAGLIDEVSLYRRCLPAAEIQSIYLAGSAGKCFTPPSITNQPQPEIQTLLAGETTILTVGVAGSTPLSYQWFLNTTNLPGATNNPLILTNLQVYQSGNYSVSVSNYAGTVMSSNASLTVVAPVTGQVVVADQAGLLSGLAAGGNVTVAVDGAIFLSQTVTISNNVTLDVGGHTLSVNGSNSVRAFFVNPGVHFRLINLSISNGSFIASNGVSAYAGGIYNNQGTVDLINCVLAGNSCRAGNWSNSPAPYYDGLPAFGGAVFNDSGTLNLTNTTFLTNTVVGGGGDGDPEYSRGKGGSIYGGAIYNNGGTVNATGCSFTGNGGSVGGMLHGLGYLGAAFGGAVYTTAGSVSLFNCTFTSNAVSSPLTLPQRPGQVGGGAICQADGTLVLNGVMFSNNTALGGDVGQQLNSPVGGACGGGLFNGGTLFATNCVFTGNTATGSTSDNAAYGQGGALHNRGIATIVNAAFFGNTATGGNKTYSFTDEGTIGGAYGGALYNSNTVVLLNSVFSGNSAYGGGNVLGNGGSAFGGAVYNLGSLYATNNTVVLNLAQGGTGSVNNHGGAGNGGGLFNQGGMAFLDYQTIASNSTAGFVGVGGGINATNGSLHLQNSIVANNISGSDFYGSFGALIDGGDNISSDISFPFTAPGSLNNTDPLLGPLGDNGGPTQTMPLLAGSPAIDAGGAGDLVLSDQRGLQRPSGSQPDIGAFELQSAPTFVISGAVLSSTLTGEISLSIGTNIISTHNHGLYELGVTNAGNYTVTPLDTNYMFVPTSISVNVGPNQTGVNFSACHWNALAMQNSADGFLQFRFYNLHSGQSFRTLQSTNLVDWTPIATNVLGSSNYFDLSIPITNGIKHFYRTVIP